MRGRLSFVREGPMPHSVHSVHSVVKPSEMNHRVHGMHRIKPRHWSC